MSMRRYNKRKHLYDLVNRKLEELGISYSDYPLNSITIAEGHKNLEVEFINFKTTSIGGVLGKWDRVSGIGLNSLRSKKGQNFDCMHELIHYWFHPEGDTIDYDGKYIPQDEEKEWEANEGAAQALMPEKLFREKYLLYSGDISALSDFFFVGEQAVKFRIENLNLGEIERVTITDKPIILREISTVKKLYCRICGNDEITASENYCKICGNDCFCFTQGYSWFSYSAGPEGKNYCSSRDCRISLYNNARYCTCCGSKSTFYLRNLLEKWELEDIERRLENLDSSVF